MIRIIEEDKSLFVLDTDNTTYAFKVLPSGHLEHLYYGRKIHMDSSDGLEEPKGFPPGNTAVPSKEVTDITLEDLRLEMSSYGKGDVREAFIELYNADGSSTSDFRYDSYEQSKGTASPEDKDSDDEVLPKSYGEEAEILTIKLKDSDNDLELDLIYTVYPSCDVITRYCILRNASSSDITIEKIMSTQIDFDPGEYVFSTFTGAWTREMNRTDLEIKGARLVNSSVTGTSSNRANPFVMISKKGCMEDFGEVYAFNLVYSGNHYESVEKSSHGKVRFLSGINPTGFTWRLQKGESFASPEAVMTYSCSGYNGMSGKMHDFVSEHILRGPWKDRLRPVLLNSWEAAYFNISESKLLRLARKAKKVGIELFVMDDGWFGQRNDDSKSLGDWYPNPKKLPHGIKGLCDKIRALGLQFGIWVEPEMVNEDSDLYRAHPDWAIRIPGKDHSTGRNQMILDLTMREVQDYLIDAMRKVFSSADISYVKWDMNRIFTDVYSQALPKERQGEVFHRYVLGLYRIMRTLTGEFPEILFEGCASGGNRFDLGILSFFPQIWASDDTDAVARTAIQNGYSYGYPMRCVTAHVSDVPNHQTLRRTPIETRFNVASFGVLGYECNLCDMSKEDISAVREQITFYKEHREVLQHGRFLRGDAVCTDDGDPGLLMPSPNNSITWTAVSEDKKSAVTMTMQILTHPNYRWRVIRPKGLKEDARYKFGGRKLDIDIRHFGGLVNFISPIHVKPDGSIHGMLSKFIKMHAEEEEHVMYGDAMMYAGVHLKNAFAGCGYDDKTISYYPDFASRIYTIDQI